MKNKTKIIARERTRTDYSKMSTYWLGQMLNGAAQGSAEQKAIKEELQRRSSSRPPRKDKGTLLLFNANEWGAMARR
jgi:hypothetical protein